MVVKEEGRGLNRQSPGFQGSESIQRNAAMVWDKLLHIYLTYKMCGAETKLNVSSLGRCIHGNARSLLEQVVENGELVGVRRQRAHGKPLYFLFNSAMNLQLFINLRTFFEDKMPILLDLLDSAPPT